VRFRANIKLWVIDESASLCSFGRGCRGHGAGHVRDEIHAVRGKFTAISAGVMVGVALFWIFPDMTMKSGMAPTALALAGALATLCAIDRFVYPVCPCCAHGVRRSAPAGPHHSKAPGGNGALIPLVIAICIHNLLDGWMAVAAGHAGSSPGSGIVVGLIAHKIPEAVVFGLMLRNATNVRNVQILSVVFTSLSILAGGAAHSGFLMFSETIVIAASLGSGLQQLFVCRRPHFSPAAEACGNPIRRGAADHRPVILSSRGARRFGYTRFALAEEQ
jgi:zinc transporter ZupT